MFNEKEFNDLINYSMNVFFNIIKEKYKDTIFKKDTLHWFKYNNYQLNLLSPDLNLLSNHFFIEIIAKTYIIKHIIKCDINFYFLRNFNDFVHPKRFNYLTYKSFITHYLNIMLFEITLLKNDAICTEIIKIINYLDHISYNEYDGDLWGILRERMIPENNRRIQSNFYTPQKWADLLISIINPNKNSKMIDFTAGTGIFLSRLGSYQFFKEGNININNFYANDIDKIAILMLICNMIRLMPNDTWFLNAINVDISNIESMNDKISEKLQIEKIRPSIKFGEQYIPIQYDLILTNPPYTRIEEMEKMNGFNKNVFIHKCLKNVNIMISKRSGMYIYSIIHELKFLKENGIFGVIIPTAWMNTEYGWSFQKFLLSNTNIKYIIRSSSELMFKDTDINTCLMILEKCSSKKKRSENKTIFITLQKDLDDILSMGKGKYWEKYDTISNIITNIKKVYFENTFLISSIEKQKNMKDTNWFNYFDKNHPILQSINNKIKNKTSSLVKYAQITSGYKTGNNKIYVLNNEKITSFNIIKKYYKPFLLQQSDIKTLHIIPNKLPHKILNAIKSKKVERDLYDFIREIEIQYNIYTKKNDQWYAKHNFTYGNIFVPCFITKFGIPFTKQKLIVSNNYFSIKTNDVMKISVLLNTSLFYYYIICNSRLNHGNYKHEEYIINNIPLLNINSFTDTDLIIINTMFNELKKINPNILKLQNLYIKDHGKIKPSLEYLSKIDAFIFNKIGLNSIEIQYFYNFMYYKIHNESKKQLKFIKRHNTKNMNESKLIKDITLKVKNKMCKINKLIKNSESIYKSGKIKVIKNGLWGKELFINSTKIVFNDIDFHKIIYIFNIFEKTTLKYYPSTNFQLFYILFRDLYKSINRYLQHIFDKQLKQKICNNIIRNVFLID